MIIVTLKPISPLEKKKNLFHSLFHQQVHSRHYLQLKTQLNEFVKGGVLREKII